MDFNQTKHSNIPGNTKHLYNIYTMSDQSSMTLGHHQSSIGSTCRVCRGIHVSIQGLLAPPTQHSDVLFTHTIRIWRLTSMWRAFVQHPLRLRASRHGPREHNLLLANYGGKLTVAAGVSGHSAVTSLELINSSIAGIRGPLDKAWWSSP